MAQQLEEIRRFGDVTFTGNQTWVAHIVAQWFTHYATAVFRI